MKFAARLILGLGIVLLLCPIVSECSAQPAMPDLADFSDKVFAVPSGTVADLLVLSRFPNAKFKYFDSVMDAALAVAQGQADAAAYDEPILKMIASRNKNLVLLPEMITVDDYAVAVNINNNELKSTIDMVMAKLKESGEYDNMVARWFPADGSVGQLPETPANTGTGVLRLGTAAITEPFSFVDDKGLVTGFDIELAQHIANRLGKRLEVSNMAFAEMIPALLAGQVDMIAACITVTQERAQKVLFSAPYYTGGIAALVRAPQAR
jgi:polar amino acid transport system substrate-binding protein